MTLVNIDLRNAGYETGPDDRVVFYSPANRNEQGTIISTAEASAPLVDGQASKELAPGPVVVQILAQGVADTRPKSGYVPEEGPVPLWDVIVDWTPALVDQGILAILAALDEALSQVGGAVDSAIGGTTSYISYVDDRFANRVVRLNDDGKLYITTSSVTGPNDPANKQYVDSTIGSTSSFISHTDDRFANQIVRLSENGKLYITTAGITGLNDPVNKQYVDNAILGSGGGQTSWWN